MPATLNITGQRFGRLVAIGDLGRGIKTGTSHIWICDCDCGNITSAMVASLRSGRTQSCGCFHLDQIRTFPRPRKSENNYQNARGLLSAAPGALALKEAEYVKQKGLCALCGNPLPLDFHKAYWDHSHITNQFRGLIHAACNTLIGYLETYPDLIQKAREYIHGR